MSGPAHATQVPDDQPVDDLVGRPVAHVSALKQVTGEAQYLDDIPPLVGELHAGFVFSSRAHARITSVDAQEALSEDGVTHFVSAKDLPPERNMLVDAPQPHIFSKWYCEPSRHSCGNKPAFELRAFVCLAIYGIHSPNETQLGENDNKQCSLFLFISIIVIAPI